MSFVKVSKNSAWSLWQLGRISGINTGFVDEPQQLILNLCINKGLNAIRLFLTEGSAGYYLTPDDYLAIGASYAADPGGADVGWRSSALTALSDISSESGTSRTYVEVAARVTEILDVCASVGMGAILTIDCWATRGNLLWTDEAVKTGIVNFWRATAAQWRTHSAVIGYDIVNEPQPDNEAHWPALALRIANAIREIDAVTPIVVEGADLGTAKGLGAFGASHPLVTGYAERKIVFSFHAYQPFGHTHGGLAESAYEQMGVTYPISGSILDYGTEPRYATSPDYPVRSAALISIRSSQELVDAYFAPAVAFKQAYGVPIFVGEFSYVDQSGGAWLDESGKYYQPDPESYCRQVTAIEVTPGDATTGKLTLVMGNIERRAFADRQGMGFRIDVSDKTPSQLALEGVTAGTADGKLKNKVRVSLEGWYPKPTRSDLTPEEQAQLDGLSLGEQTLNDQVWNISDKLGALLPSQREVTIARGDHRYEIVMNTTGLTSIPAQDPVMDGASVLRYPPVALVSLAPSEAHMGTNGSNWRRIRENYAADILVMCQQQGFSWSWHAVSTEVGRHEWAADSLIYQLMYKPAMGRRLEG
ncbi:MAG TPA: cellulase family glycosylhydrolase [Aquabacterium sp.]|uniref:glycoside hydrolase family 5 protein n=1 Tax=Aquabacterium sp. TaxID=1872578 RepID=UPI002E323734|nr:cellulase family glycosylhydrolase [Aquabacterium sp.]HEX5372454.1 cellulase family glycosylhydrolase [Aquabacterium sp.]